MIFPVNKIIRRRHHKQFGDHRRQRRPPDPHPRGKPPAKNHHRVEHAIQERPSDHQKLTVLLSPVPIIMSANMMCRTRKMSPSTKSSCIAGPVQAPPRRRQPEKQRLKVHKPAPVRMSEIPDAKNGVRRNPRRGLMFPPSQRVGDHRHRASPHSRITKPTNITTGKVNDIAASA